jgi:PAS domain S-box-containing protein
MERTPSPSAEPDTPATPPLNSAPDVQAERFRVALSASSIVVFNQDSDLRYTWIGNPALGASREDLIGRTDEEIMGEEAARPLTAIKRRVLERGVGERAELLVSRGDHSGWFDVTVEPLRDQAGKIVGITCAAIDLKERKQAEAALRNSEMLRFQALQSSQDLVFAVDHQYRLLFNNRVHQQILQDSGAAPMSVGECVLSIAYPADFLEWWRSAYDRGLNGESFVSEFEWTTESGTKRVFEDAFSPLQDTSGLIMGCLVVGREVTERRRAERALKESEQRFALLVHNSPFAIGISRLSDDQFIDVNDAFVRLYGYSREELIGRSSAQLSLWHSGDRESVVRRLKENKTRQVVEMRARRKDGALRDVFASIDFIQFGEERCMVGFLADITEQKAAMEELRKKESVLTEAQRLAGVGNWEWDLRSDRHAWSAEVYKIYGRDPSLPPAAYPEVARYFTRSSWERLTEVVEGALKTGQSYVCDVEVVRENGEHRWITARGEAQRDENGELRTLHGTLQDITERKRLEEERAEAITRLNDIQGEVRRRIARDLHDQTAQMLVALSVGLKNLETSLASGRPFSAQLQALRREVDDVQTQVRDITWELRTGERASEGLEYALRTYLEDWSERVQIPAEFECRGLAGVQLPNMIEDALYRIAQESLSNVQRHSNARHLSVMLEYVDQTIRLFVEDDGDGFDPEAQRNSPDPKSHLGLLGMRERVALAGGTFMIESSVGSGTTILVRIPLPHKESQ